ncbi:hypothetical protein CfE428DRAFT_4534 [Chthoniobacter flavus Ellin428]|uniref:Uncharacterized protein n=1 Tax=Chthoniobacter flavus Ellin428 TaxID=497964 RepID=B4D6J4_9BACT|nr:hypothetical protein [Chthoniobacter flavus]EDY17795.1 hypothetical protein CfE428DRAFT_4534 [Chthoniobacter flavus Ellin428]TCO88408.1 hypothetical protein EV701_11710 [Chthoniobacter flavus]
MSAAAPVSSPRPQTGLDPLGLLAARLNAADRILQKERGAILFFRSWPWALGAVVAAIIADVVLHLSGSARFGIDLAFAFLALLDAAWCGWLAWGKHNSFEHIARTLEARHPRLGSKLINLLQLRSQTQDPTLAPLTRELAGLAIGSYAEELRNEPIEQLARTARVESEAKYALFGFFGFVVLLAISFDITRTELPRFLDPFGDHPPYSFTRLEITDPGYDGAQVVYHENLVVTARSSGHRPAELYLSWFPAGHPEQTSTLPMFDRGEHGFAQQVENVQSDLVVFVHTKNQHAISKQRRVSVVLTPRLEKAWVKITPPAYTGLAATEKLFDFKTVKALEGSTIAFRLASNRPLASGRISVSTDSGNESVTMTRGEQNQVVGQLEAKKPAQLKFSFVDRDGYSSQDTLEATLTVTHDLPPDVQVANPGSDAFVAMDYQAEPAIEASDDYGLKTLRIHTAHNGVFGEPKIISYDHITLHAHEVVPLDFQSLNLQSGDTVSLFAEAIDNAPQPHLARSKTVTLTVISTQEYNDFLRQQTDISDIEAKYTKLLNDMRDLVEQQKKLSDETAALKQQLDAAKSDAEKAAVQKKLNDLLAKQNALNAQLNQLAKTMEHLVRDQPLYDIESDLKDTLAEKAQQIRDSTQTNAEDLKKIAQPGANAPQAPSQAMLDDFKRASDDQLQRLGATEQQVADEVIQPLEDMSLMQEIIKDLNRYEDLYAAQQELARQAQAYNRPAPLSREDQLALKNLAAQQKAIGDDLDALEQKLWEDGKATKEKFPKAAESAQSIADKMGDLKLQMLANQTSREMVNGNGGGAAALAENLRSEMARLFSQCQAQDGPMSNELDQYLGFQHGMKPGMNFRQMMQCHKFGSGLTGSMGQGYSGRNGFAIISGQNPHVLGNEALPGNAAKVQKNGDTKGRMPQNAGQSVTLDKSDVVHDLNSVNRESEAVQSETIIQQYRGLVEEYFKALTKDPKKETKPKARP